MKSILTVFMVFGFFLNTTFAQEQSKFGVGFEFHTLPATFAQGQGTPLGVSFTIVSESFIIEPFITYSSSTIEYDYIGSGDSKTTESDLTLLIGIFKTIKRGNIRSYFGIRVGKSWWEFDAEGASSDDEIDYFILAPTIGAEYFLSDNFSFGGEGLFTMVSSEIDEDSYDKTTKNNTIIPRFIVRFYF